MRVSWVPVAIARTRAIRRVMSLRIRIERLRCCVLSVNGDFKVEEQEN